MGLFDEVMSMASGGAQAQHSGALGAVMDYINSPQVGGIGGLQKMFHEKGLGGIVSSWISTGRTCRSPRSNCKACCTAKPYKTPRRKRESIPHNSQA